ncbi:Rhodanese-like domain-containing protein 8, chloroplastic [Apostasia shenzhenica]|uniref:Rhodanese-like domain-containing protein 8, chloroplastic n=2 Tax=Magnoliopsida TaxID=3398 RepID=A0A2H9ZY59_9ASPA|nr:Rhodanese-like domain-containing protein 8, chloroplastic [Apostasia shenzhenica]
MAETPSGQRILLHQPVKEHASQYVSSHSDRDRIIEIFRNAILQTGSPESFALQAVQDAIKPQKQTVLVLEENQSLENALRTLLQELVGEYGQCENGFRVGSGRLKASMVKSGETTMQYGQPIDNDNEKGSCGHVPRLLDIVLYLCGRGHIEGGMIFQLLEDLTEMSTMKDCKEVFGYIESKQDILGKANDVVFCGRILMFLAHFFPLSERSAVNIKGHNNITNETKYEKDAPAGEFQKPSHCNTSTCQVAKIVLDAFEAQPLSDDDGNANNLEQEEAAFSIKYLTSSKLMGLELWWKWDVCPPFEKQPTEKKVGQDIAKKRKPRWRLGNKELSQLWKWAEQNPNALTDVQRVRMPSVAEYWKPLAEDVYCWKGLRFSARQDLEGFSRGVVPPELLPLEVRSKFHAKPSEKNKRAKKEDESKTSAQQPEESQAASAGVETDGGGCGTELDDAAAPMDSDAAILASSHCPAISPEEGQKQSPDTDLGQEAVQSEPEAEVETEIKADARQEPETVAEHSAACGSAGERKQWERMAAVASGRSGVMAISPGLAFPLPHCSSIPSHSLRISCLSNRISQLVSVSSSKSRIRCCCRISELAVAASRHSVDKSEGIGNRDVEFLVVSFYKFVSIGDPATEVSKHHAFLKYSGPHEDALAYADWVKEDSRFFDTLVQTSPALGGHAFPKLKLRARLQKLFWTGYEWDVGHFQGAKRPDVECFRCTSFGLSTNTVATLDPLSSVDKENTDILMYCTGGIRCDVYSTILRSSLNGRQRGFQNLYTLKGGVSHYLLNEGSAGWLGNLFVFDSRLSLPPPTYNPRGTRRRRIGIISENGSFAKCYICSSQILEFRHRNCANLDCNRLFLCCGNCVKEFKGCCCSACTQAPRLRPVLHGHQRYQKWHLYRDSLGENESPLGRISSNLT